VPAEFEDYPRSRDFDPRTVMDAWSSFVAGGPWNAGAVRDSIGASWRRCKAAGLDPHGPCGPTPGAGTPDLGARRLERSDLLDAAEHTWALMADSLIANDSLFVLADPEGVLLDVRGNGELVGAAARARVGAGCDWSEQASGTNAVGTAIALGRPVVVRTAEHYLEAAKMWDCAAAPVRDLDDGALLGVLDVTSVGNLCDSHTLALAVTAARQIEHALHSRALAFSVELLNWYRANADRWHDRLTLLLDRKGRVIAASDELAAQTALRTLHADTRNAVPSLPGDVPFTVASCLPYRRPDTVAGAAAAARSWHGGVVVVEARTSSGHGKRPVATAGGGARARHPAFRSLVTADARTLACIAKAERLARAAAPVLLSGETGSGKELFARAIHECSACADGPFVAVNCGILSRDLAASELLGYEPGAFTGASGTGRAGKFEQADGGTLFLDEIGELPLDVQVHLLRVLQDGIVVRLGGNRERQVNVRIIAASNRDLGVESESGRFRRDLLYRLKVLALELPPLRGRRGDIPLLVAHFLERLQATYGLGARTASAELLATLEAYDWPGNVRELHGVVESLYVLGDRAVLATDDLPDDFPRLDGARISAAGGRDQPTRLVDLERDAIVRELVRDAAPMSEIGRRLGISRTTLYRKMKEYGLERR
jgi:transcriptional regulator of acetoin/glycerol metabolism